MTNPGGGVTAEQWGRRDPQQQTGLNGIYTNTGVFGNTKRTTISEQRFMEWLQKNLPGVSGAAAATFWKNYQDSGQIPFTSMQRDASRLEQLSAADMQGTSAGSVPTTAAGSFGTGVRSAADDSEGRREDARARTAAIAAGAIPADAPNPNAGIGGGSSGGGIGIEFPEYNPISIPGITDTDFTDVAKQRVAEIYAKQYQALDNLLNQAGQQYEQNKPVMAGIYSQLGGDLGNIKAGVTSDLDQQKQQQAAQGQELQGQIANIYAPTASQTAQIAAGSGLDNSQNQAAADTQRQFAQGQAAESTQTQADYLTNAGNSYTNWLAGTQAAAGNEGAVQQSNLLNNYGQIRANLANQRLGIGSQELQDVLNLENQLSDEDMRKQQWLADIAMRANESQNAANQQNYENQYGAYRDEKNYGLDVAKQQQAAAAAAGKSSGGSGAAPKSLAAIKQQIIADYGDVELANKAVQTVSDVLGNGPNSVDLASFPAIFARITAVALANGDNPEAYQDVALALTGGVPVGNLSQDQIATE